MKYRKQNRVRKQKEIGSKKKEREEAEQGNCKQSLIMKDESRGEGKSD